MIFVEAETAARPPAMWLAFDGRASDLYYVWLRKREAPAVLTLPVTLPAKARYTIWARLRSGSMTVAGQTLTAGGDRWTWSKSPQPVELPAGAQTIQIAAGQYGSAIDALYFSTDGEFVPSGRNATDATPPPVPTDLTATPDGPFVATLTWTASEARDLHHYNLYVGDEPGFAPSQATLIASPDRPRYVDWQVDPKRRQVYKLTAVDRQGNESAPSAAAVLSSAEFEPVRVTADVTDGTARFEVPAGGTYVVWLYFVPRHRRGGYVGLDFDAGKIKRTWTLRFNRHLCKQGGWFSYGQFATVELGKGSHDFSVASKYNDITKLVLTNDFSFAPAGYRATAHVW